MKSNNDRNSPNEYRTGGSVHRSGSGALLAVGLFVSLTFLGMILTAGMLILRVNPSGQQKVIAFLSVPKETQSSDNSPHMEGLVVSFAEFGIIGQTISEFCENYYELPSGIYVIRVAQHTQADIQGVLPGDILVAANGQPLDSPNSLQEVIDSCPTGELIPLDVSRKGKIFTVYFISGE